ncbi:FkbM family methyltransferase [Limnohabitans sp. 2KL-27]|uniref:FkbM family methyltransferase n=1 Tax=Limnohabitans sp. 2KL-27 TaxID=1100705 RepID=UPI000AFD58F8|nr:FkbM family methyltransferase [Limnohabitans sp. 2KL-27]
MQKIINIYVFLFARVFFVKFNKLLYRLSLSGLGILNYKTSAVSGEKNFIDKFMRCKHGVVIDIGANVGDYIAELININKGLTIHAFEPHPLTFLKLRKNTVNYENVFVYNQGASSKRGLLNLYDYGSNDGSQHASLFRDVISEIHGSKSVTSHEVELIDLDGFIEMNNILEILLLKIDTEGNELEVIRGCAKSIASGKIKAIHFEFNEMNVASRVFFKDFWTILSDYDFYRLLPNGMMKINKYHPLFCEVYAYQNIVAIYKN